MACTDIRIDNVDWDYNVSPNVAQTVYDASRGTAGKLYFLYVERQSDALNSFHNQALYFNDFDIFSETAGVPQKLVDQAAGVGLGIDACAMVRMSDTALVGAYGINSVQTKESADNGVTWSVQSAVDAGGTRALAGLIANGTAAWCVTYESSGGGASRDVYLYKRTAANTWDAGRKIFDSPGGGLTPFPFFDSVARTGGPIGVMKPGDPLVGFILCDFNPTIVGTTQVVCLWTIDGWTTVGQVVVADYLATSGSFARSPMSYLGADGTARCAWVDNDLVFGETPVLAYTANYGQTWTLLGTPAPLQTIDWDASWNRAMALGPDNKWYVAAFFTVGGTNEEHYVFSGGDTLVGWTTQTCGADLNILWSGGTVGYGLVAPGATASSYNFYRVFNKIIAAATPTTTTQTVNLLVHHGIYTIPTAPPVCIVTPLSDYIVLPSGSVQMCGPTAPSGSTYTWAWTGPGGFTATTQCITVTTAGTYTLTVTDGFGQATSCQGIAISVPAPPETTATGESIPHHRGLIPVEPSGHPSGTPTIRRVGR